MRRQIWPALLLISCGDLPKFERDFERGQYCFGFGNNDVESGRSESAEELGAVQGSISGVYQKRPAGTPSSARLRSPFAHPILAADFPANGLAGCSSEIAKFFSRTCWRCVSRSGVEAASVLPNVMATVERVEHSRMDATRFFLGHSAITKLT